MQTDFNVISDFGADPTGAGVSLVAFQKAIEQAEACGGSVYVPSGTYTLNKSLIITKSLKLHGVRGASILDFKTLPPVGKSDGASFGLAGISIGDGGETNAFGGLIVEGLTLYGPGQDAAGVDYGTGLSIRTQNLTQDAQHIYLDGLVFRDITIRDFRVGLHAMHTQCSLFQTLRITGCSVNAILTDDVNNVDFHRCSLGSSLSGVVHIGCNGVNYTSCDFEQIPSPSMFTRDLPLRKGTSITAGDQHYDLGVALSLNGSQITVVNPYFEDVANFIADLRFYVGRSAIYFLGGVTTSNKVRTNQSQVTKVVEVDVFSTPPTVFTQQN